MDKAWLPDGYHNGLHIEHRPTGRGGQYTGGGWKVIWHTTQGRGLRAMSDVLVNKRAEPHFLIGELPGREALTVVQFIPLTKASRALEHPAGTADTNNAHAVQVEIAGFAEDAAKWDEHFLRGLANLTELIEHRVPVPRKVPRRFSDTPNRYTGTGFVKAKGHMGHQHVANQPSGHWDPGKFNCRHMLSLVN